MSSAGVTLFPPEKAALGIAGVQTNVCSWFLRGTEERCGAQIDLVTMDDLFMALNFYLRNNGFRNGGFASANIMKVLLKSSIQCGRANALADAEACAVIAMQLL